MPFRKALQEESKPNGNSVIYRLYVIVIGTYAGIQFFISFFMRIPACHNLTNQCDRFPLIRFFKWMRQVLISQLSLFVLYALIFVFPSYDDLLYWSICLLFPMLIFKERHYVGRGMYERTTDFIKYSQNHYSLLSLIFFGNFVWTL